jgi:hypothetical protein
MVVGLAVSSSISPWKALVNTMLIILHNQLEREFLRS